MGERGELIVLCSTGVNEQKELTWDIEGEGERWGGEHGGGRRLWHRVCGWHVGGGTSGSSNLLLETRRAAPELPQLRLQRGVRRLRTKGARRVRSRGRALVNMQH